MSTAVASPTAARMVRSFRFAFCEGSRMTEKNKRRLEVVEHVEGFAGGRVSWQGNDGTACWVVVTVERPVRVQAAEDICRTCPQYVRGSFEVVAPAA